MKNIYILLSIFALTFATYSCEGDEGPAGPAGAANIVSEEFTFVASDVRQNSENNFSAEHNTNALTEAIVKEGVVLGYFEIEGVWTPLPYNFFDGQITFFADTGLFTVLLYGPDVAEDVDFLTGVRFRMVAIPPEEVNPSLDYEDYDAVAQEYGLINSDFQQ